MRLDRAETYADIAPEHDGGVRAYVTAMRGCDKFCAFCVVPYVRGRERSVPADALIREISALAARGVKEVVLLGQTVNAYRFDEVDFGRLAADGRRGRRHRAHPLHFAASERHERIGRSRRWRPSPRSSRISICRCNRARTGSWPRWIAATPSRHYLDLVSRLRAAIPDLALSTDIIVGFHGEEESDFDATLDLMRAVRYDSAFTFKYSVREHTRAYKLGDSVSEEEKGRRLVGGDRASGADLGGTQSRAGRMRSSRCWSKGRRGAATRCWPARRPSSRPRYSRNAPESHPETPSRCGSHRRQRTRWFARLWSEVPQPRHYRLPLPVVLRDPSVRSRSSRLVELTVTSVISRENPRLITSCWHAPPSMS